LLFGAGWGGVSLSVWAVLVGVRDDFQQLLEGLEVLAPDGGIEGCFYEVVAGDEGWACGAHGG